MHRLGWFCKNCQTEGSVNVDPHADVRAAILQAHKVTNKVGGMPYVLVDIDHADVTVEETSLTVRVGLPNPFGGSSFLIVHIQ